MIKQKKFSVFQMFKQCFEIVKCHFPWLAWNNDNRDILFCQETVVRAGLICHPNGEQLLKAVEKNNTYLATNHVQVRMAERSKALRSGRSLLL